MSQANSNFVLRKDIVKKYKNFSSQAIQHIIYTRLQDLILLVSTKIPTQGYIATKKVLDYDNAISLYIKVCKVYIWLKHPKLLTRVVNFFHRRVNNKLEKMSAYFKQYTKQNIYDEICTLEYMAWRKREIAVVGRPLFYGIPELDKEL